jgi:hypothetical protein
MLAAMIIEGAVVDPGIISGPAGWTSAQQNIAGTGLIDRAALLYNIAGASEAGSYTFTWSNLAVDGFWIFAEYQGGDSVQALDGLGDNIQNGVGTASVAPSLSPSAWNNYNTLVCVWAASLVALSVMSMTTSSGMTIQAQSSSTLVSFPAIMLADLALSSSASTGTKTATPSVSTSSLGISVLIKQSNWAGIAPVGGST